MTQVDHGEQKKLRGLLCRVRLEDFANGVVLPHEETLSKAKEDRFRLMRATHCNFSPIYSLYRDEAHVTRQRMDNLAAACPPRYEFSDGLVTHRLWVVNDQAAIAALQEDFAGRKLYIADGHHRYETALRYRDACRAENRYEPGGRLCDDDAGGHGGPGAGGVPHPPAGAGFAGLFGGIPAGGLRGVF